MSLANDQNMVEALASKRPDAARRLRPEVSKNSSTALFSNEGGLARLTTTCPSPVMVLMPLLGEAATTSPPPWRRMGGREWLKSLYGR
jgi:hypothetical protein